MRWFQLPLGLMFSEDEEVVKQAYHKPCRVPTVFSDDAVPGEEVHQIELVSQLEHDFNCLIRRGAHHQVLHAYQSDATSFLCRAQVSTQLHDQETIPRRGRHLIEFLTDRAVFKRFKESGKLEMVMYFRCPRSLFLGKSADHHFVAHCEFAPMFRERGLTSVAILFACLDRAVCGGDIARRLAQWRCAF